MLLSRKLKISSSQAFFILCLYVWNLGTLSGYVKSILFHIPLIEDIAGLLVFFLVSLIVVFSYRRMSKDIKVQDLIFCFVATFVYLFYAFSGKYSRSYLMDNMELVLLGCLPVYFVGICFDYFDEKLNRYMYYSSLISILIQVYHIMASYVSLNTQTDNMDLAYRILPHVCLICYYFLLNRKIFDLFFVIMGMFSLVAYGTRGAIVLAVIYFVICSLIIIEHKRKILFVISWGVICAIIYLYFYEFIRKIRDMIGHYGIRTRIFDRILQGTFLVSGGRNDMNHMALELIKKSPIHGYGLAADRYFCGVYVHNIFLELCISFGVIIGTILVLYLIYLIIRACTVNKNKGIIMIIMIYVCGGGFLKLFLSSSFMFEYQFFLLIGLCVGVIRKNRLNNYEEGVDKLA